MAQVLVQFDPKITHANIVVPLTNTSNEEVGEDNYSKIRNQENIQQTSILGVATPLIQINNIAINFNNIIDFKLDCKNPTPTISMTVVDSNGLITNLDDTGNDNELTVQILPAYDNAYKKINLSFFISSIRITGKNLISLTGIYKLPLLTSSNIKSFGELNTFDFFKAIAEETGLGFATNVETNDQDKHYIYCDNKSYLDVMNREINYSGSEKQIFDYWIDYWNNLNYVDVYERYNSKDQDKDLMIWVSGGQNQNEAGLKTHPYKISATLTTHPSFKNSDLFVSSYNIVNRSGSSIYNGTDKVYSIYEKNKQEYEDHLIQDGDIKKDIYSKFEYLGETYSDFNYLLMNKCRDAYIQKINSETVEVTLNTPMISLMRGHKVNFANYIVDDKLQTKLKSFEKDGIISGAEAPENLDIPLTDKEQTLAAQRSANGQFMLDKKISGQYLIIGNTIRYYNNHWETTLVLARPASQKPKQINLD